MKAIYNLPQARFLAVVVSIIYIFEPTMSLAQLGLGGRFGGSRGQAQEPQAVTNQNLPENVVNLTLRLQADESLRTVGRSQFVRDLRAHIATGNVVLITGDSGAGKTHLVEGSADMFDGRQVFKILLREFMLEKATASALRTDLLSVMAHVQSSSAKGGVLFIDDVHLVDEAHQGVKGGLEVIKNIVEEVKRTHPKVSLVLASSNSSVKQTLVKSVREIKVPVFTLAQVETILRTRVESIEKEFNVEIPEDAIKVAAQSGLDFGSGSQSPVGFAIDVLRDAALDLDFTIKQGGNRLAQLTDQLEELIQEKASIERTIKKNPSLADDYVDRLEKINSELNAVQHEFEITNQLEQLQSDLNGAADEATRGQLKLKLNSLLQEHSGLGFKVSERVVRTSNVNYQVAKRANLSLDFINATPRERINKAVLTIRDEVLNQAQASDAVRRVLTIREGFPFSRRAPSILVFAGPTGVGKTFTAQLIAEHYFGDKTRIELIEGNNLTQGHEVSSLKGSPAGYTGYGDETFLDRIQSKGGNIVLLIDEIEKAHRSIFTQFMGAFERGSMQKANGQIVDLSNVIIVMTTNAGERYPFLKEQGKTIVEIANELEIRPEDTAELVKKPESQHYAEIVKLELAKKGAVDAVMGRIESGLVVFNPARIEDAIKLVRLELDRAFSKDPGLVQSNIQIKVSDSAVAAIALSGFNPDLGVRPIRKIVESDLREFVANYLVQMKLAKSSVLFIDTPKLSSEQSSAVLKMTVSEPRKPPFDGGLSLKLEFKALQPQPSDRAVSRGVKPKSTPDMQTIADQAAKLGANMRVTGEASALKRPGLVLPGEGAADGSKPSGRGKVK